MSFSTTMTAKTPSTKIPLVCVLDIDGTLVGDVRYDVAEWDLLQRIGDAAMQRAFRSEFIKRLERGLMRPHLSDFIVYMKSLPIGCEFFIYTASDDDWAKFIVPCIEAAAHVKFERPIFSRQNCIPLRTRRNSNIVMLYKSLDKIAPVVCNKLRPRYPRVSPKAINSGIFLVDNSDVLIPGERHRCIQCPTYQFLPVRNILTLLSDQQLTTHVSTITRVLKQHGLVPASSTVTQAIAYYNELLAVYRSQLHVIVQENQSARGDVYWLALMNVFKRLQQKSVGDAVQASRSLIRPESTRSAR